jgi:uncharacterized membrane protein
MTKTPAPARSCQVCGTTTEARLRRAIIVRPALAELISVDVPAFTEDGWICTDDLDRYRAAYVQSLLAAERGELTSLEQEVADSLAGQDLLVTNQEREFTANQTFGQRLADRIAGFGGSWTFLMLFGVVMAVWMLLNSAWLQQGFDPFPFILLNLVLSCIAAVQAPVIMMSQNRQEARDRSQARHDYQVNLKAELEIRQLHQKFDHQLSRQWERLVEIQEIQLELRNELRRR